MTAIWRRNYISLQSLQYNVCHHHVYIMQACDIIWKLSERMAKIISKCAKGLTACCMFHTKCHTIGRGRLTVCQSWSWRVHFQHTAFILNLHPTTTQFPTVSRGPIVAHSPLLEFKTPHISKFSWSWVKHYRGLTHVNTDVKDLQARIVHVIVTSRTSTPNSLQSSIL